MPDLWPEIRQRLADAVLTVGTVDECCSFMVADAVIHALGLREQVQKIGVDCEDCEQFTLRRWVTDWEVLDG